MVQLVRWVERNPRVRRLDFLFLLIRPPRVLGRPARQIGFARHFLRSAKFLTMAKQKNRLTTTKTKNRSVVTFFFRVPSDRTGHADRHDIPHAFHRRLWRALRPFEVDYRVGRADLPCTYPTHPRHRRSGGGTQTQQVPRRVSGDGASPWARSRGGATSVAGATFV